MARINIEDSLLKDDRFSELMLKLGSRIMALGVITEAFILAQKHYLTDVNDRLIPLNDWQRKTELHILLDVGLAEVKNSGIYIKGSESNFKWLLQKQAAGKSSAESKRIKRTMESTYVNGRSTAGNGSQPLTLTPTLTPTLSSFSNSSSLGTKQKKSVKNEHTEENRKIWAVYENAYRLRYGINPVKNATVNSQISNLRKKLGTEESLMVVEFYLKHENSFYLKNTHTFGLCLKDAETLRTQAIKGVAITSGMVRSFEKKQNENEIIAALEKQWGKNE